MGGKYYEELEVGVVLRHQPGRTVTEADNIWFSCLTMNPQPLHVDFHAAGQAEFGKPLVNSLFTLGVAVLSGILGVTFFGLFLTPVFYVLIRRFVTRGAKPDVPAAAAVPPLPPAHGAAAPSEGAHHA